MKDLFWFYLGDAVAQQGGLGVWKDLARQMAQQETGGNAPRMEQLR
jgi:hypothetical protein